MESKLYTTTITLIDHNCNVILFKTLNNEDLKKYIKKYAPIAYLIVIEKTYINNQKIEKRYRFIDCSLNVKLKKLYQLDNKAQNYLEKIIPSIF